MRKSLCTAESAGVFSVEECPFTQRVGLFKVWTSCSPTFMKMWGSKKSLAPWTLVPEVNERPILQQITEGSWLMGALFRAWNSGGDFRCCVSLENLFELFESSRIFVWICLQFTNCKATEVISVYLSKTLASSFDLDRYDRNDKIIKWKTWNGNAIKAFAEHDKNACWQKCLL